MEGLIPLVCRALKKNKIRRRYECLSSGAAARGYDGAGDCCIGEKPQNSRNHTESYDHHNRHHRRYSSAGDYASRFPPDDDVATATDDPPPARKQLVRFSSHRI